MEGIKSKISENNSNMLSIMIKVYLYEVCLSCIIYDHLFLFDDYTNILFTIQI